MAVPSNSTALPTRKSTDLRDLLRSADRRRMEAAIETLIAALDALDGDSDLEPATDDEPSIGWPLGASGATAFQDSDDRELDDEREFTALERHGGGFVWSGADDDEDSHDSEYCVADHFGIGDMDGVAEQGFLGMAAGAVV